MRKMENNKTKLTTYRLKMQTVCVFWQDSVTLLMHYGSMKRKLPQK